MQNKIISSDSFKGSHTLSVQRDLEFSQPPRNILQYAREAKLEIRKPCQIYFQKKIATAPAIRTLTSKWQ